MPHNYGSRLTITFLVLLVCIFGIPGIGDGILKTSSLFKGVPFSQKVNLKPGIDIAGGTSLTYEIKQVEGSTGPTRTGGQTLAEQVAAALKRRVDPNGVLNLVWRPQGDTRLEIQIPRTAHSGDRDKAQKALASAREELREINDVGADDVTHAVEQLKGAERDKKLTELAAGSKQRLELFHRLAKLHDEIEQDKAAYTAAKGDDEKTEIATRQATAEIAYDKAKKEIGTAGVAQDELETILSLPQAEQQKRVDAVIAQAPDFTARTKAIKDYQAAYGEYNAVKGSLDDAADLKRLLRGSGVLEYHILVSEQDVQGPQAQAMIERLRTKGPSGQANDQMRWYLVDNPEEFGKHNTYTMDGDPDHHYSLAWAIPGKQMVHNVPGQQEWKLADARAGIDPNNGNRLVEFSFDSVGARFFGDLTRNNINNPLAIILDNKMISAPNINSEIGANGQITGGGAGGFAPKEQMYLVNTLKAGSLPASLADEPTSERTVSPQLGTGNLYKGLVASGIGIIVVGVFLIGYYYLAGVVAFIAVLMNLIIILGVLAMLGATFTMPTIAGIVLTIGTAVDANVLIFERMREEEHRGFPLKLALQHAYDRALSAIVDSNMTTILVSLFLYFFGTEEVKGFGLTLVIGITSSLFTALYVTKTIFAILINEYGIKELGSIPTSFPKWDKLLKPNIDWMKLIWPFIAFSTVFIIVGMSAFVVKKRQMFDIEFASGTSVQFELKHDMTQSEVSERLGAKAEQIPSASVVSLNNRSDFYEVVTPNENAAEVREAVLSALGPDLKIELPSRFVGAQPGGVTDVTKVLGQQVLPIENDKVKVDGKNVPDIGGYVGGGAIVLKDLSPPISAQEIRSRIDRAAAAPPETNLSRFKYEVIPFVNGNPSANKADLEKPVSEAVVLVQQPDFLYSKSADAWRDNVGGVMWRLANEGVGREAKLQRVSNFDPQVAGDAQREAMMATILSILAIMVYIWFRFGDMKYATATVVALVHDTVAVVGAIGLSHYLDNGFGHFLLIEPFRINVTLVAAILTIMGYSMIDTIVVFDRIRENRGRYGKLTRQVINDSINQTLSRTLLTAGTTLITVTTMYLLGGPAIHGFTFVLLVGILIGTYSSIAIASPILLIGAGKEAAAAAEESKSSVGPGARVGGAQLRPR